MRSLSLISGAFAALALAACTAPSDDTTADANAIDVTVHDGEFATIQQFTTPGGVSVWLVEEPSIPILSLRLMHRMRSISNRNQRKHVIATVVTALANDVCWLDDWSKAEFLLSLSTTAAGTITATSLMRAANGYRHGTIPWQR